LGIARHQGELALDDENAVEGMGLSLDAGPGVGGGAARREQLVPKKQIRKILQRIRTLKLRVKRLMLPCIVHGSQPPEEIPGA
jgi:hypothetical protein